MDEGTRTARRPERVVLNRHFGHGPRLLCFPMFLTRTRNVWFQDENTENAVPSALNRPYQGQPNPNPILAQHDQRTGLEANGVEQPE